MFYYRGMGKLRDPYLPSPGNLWTLPDALRRGKRHYGQRHCWARGIALRVGADGLGDEYLDRLRVADPGQALVVLPGCCDLQRLVAGRLELVGAEVIAK